nr:hypothetical protein [Tanacetum cinerariifolium]
QQRGRPQDAVVVALGQYDVAALALGPLQQPVLEHVRRPHRHVALEGADSQLDFLRIVGCDARANGAHPVRGFERASGHHQDGYHVG